MSDSVSKDIVSETIVPEIRVLFEPAAGDAGFQAMLTDADGDPLGVPSLVPSLLDDGDYENLRWYLEEYMDLPDGGATVRAGKIETQLSDWGRQLYQTLFQPVENREALQRLLAAPEPRVLTIATERSDLLRLPWELMADDAGHLAQRLSVRRQLANRLTLSGQHPDAAVPDSESQATTLPLRLLYIVSRPHDTGFIDPRMTAKSLHAALAPLDDNVRIDYCRPPTLPRMEEMLRDAQAAGQPYHVVHFDGHGTFLQEAQIGALCFEQADDGTGDSKTDFVRADRLGNLLASHRIPLVVLEACRTATLGRTMVFRSVAPRLIQAGVESVLSMSHAVHVEAARILLDRFYREIVRGTTIGRAVAEGRKALVSAPSRWIETGPRGRTIDLDDWFLPHLYQRGGDPRLIPVTVAESTASVRRYDVFLSHNHNDKPRVEALARVLTEKHGLRVWLDGWECGPGRLEPQCEAGIRDSRFTVVAGSQAALNSKWVAWEIKKHGQLNPEGDRLIPVKFEPLDLPRKLDQLYWLDFTDPDQDGEGAALIARHVRAAEAEDARRRRGFREPATTGQVGGFPRGPQYGFHGRARELYELERTFRRQRGLVLHAMGGMGKTTLAIEAANWWTQSGLFRDGACFVSFEQFVNAERVIAVLGEYCEGPKFHQRPAVEQRRRAIEFFRDRDVLMVWDNFESTLEQFGTVAWLSRAEQSDALAEGSALESQATPYTDEERHRLAELFRDLTSGEGRGRVLVTCRPGETGLEGAGRMELHGLARPDSLWLLQRILELRGIGFQPVTPSKNRSNADRPSDEISSDEISSDESSSDDRLEAYPTDDPLSRERLDPLLDDLADHPLSLELVGPHLATLTPEAIRGDFGQLFEQFHQESDQGRNRSLLASLEFSRRHLSAEARDALRWLGLFSGGVFEVNLLAVSQLDPEAWSGPNQPPGVSPMAPELSRTMAFQGRRDADFDGLGRPSYDRSDPTLASARRLISIRDELEGIALLRVETDLKIGDRPFLRFHPTLAIASADAALAADRAVHERFIQVYLALMQMLDRALKGSQSRAALAILQREEGNYRTAVRQAVALGQHPAAAALGETFSLYLQRSGRLRERDAWVGWLRDAVAEAGFTAEAAAYERQHAWTRFTSGDPQGAVEQLESLIARLRETTEFDAAFQLAIAVGMLGRVLHTAGASAQAIPVLREAVGHWESLVEQAGGQPWEALVGQASSLASGGERQAGSLPHDRLVGLSATMGDLANALGAGGQHDDALEMAERCVTIQQACGNQREVATAHGQCARILMAAGRYDEADARYALALAAARQAGDLELEGITLQNQGILADDRNQLTRATGLYQQALQRFQEAGNSQGVMQTYNLLGVAEQKAGRLAEARAWYEKSRELARQLNDQPCLGQAAQNIGIVWQKEGEAARAAGDESAARQSFEQARQSVEESLKVCQDQGNQPYEAESLSQLARIHLLLGDLDAADRHAHAAREIRESLGLKEVFRTYHTLSEIAEARGDTAAAAEWAAKRDAMQAENRRRAGGGGLPADFLRACQSLMLACARAGFADEELGPGEEEALAQLDGQPEPLPAFAGCLRQLAAGRLPEVPDSLPPELRQLLAGLLEAVRNG